MNTECPPSVVASSLEIQAKKISAQVARAITAGQNYVREALIAGQMLSEYRLCFHHGSKHANQHTDREETIIAKIESFGIRKRRAYKWIDAAERVACDIFPLAPGGKIEIDGAMVFLSEILTASDDAPESHVEARDHYFRLVAGRTLADCIAGIIDGDDPADIRAFNGKMAPQIRGAARKNWPLFQGKHFKVVDSMLGDHWKDMSENKRMEFKQVLRASLLGGAAAVSDDDPARATTYTFQGVPKDVLDYIFEEICDHRAAINNNLRKKQQAEQAARSPNSTGKT